MQKITLRLSDSYPLVGSDLGDIIAMTYNLGHGRSISDSRFYQYSSVRTMVEIVQQNKLIPLHLLAS